MTNLLDLLNPVYLKEDRIGVQVEQGNRLLALQPITVEFDYSAADPVGVELPMEVVVAPGFGQGGEGDGYRSKVFRRSVPTSYTFTVPGAGQYLVMIREISHNRWWGRLVIEVGGDQFSRVLSTGRG